MRDSSFTLILLAAAAGFYRGQIAANADISVANLNGIYYGAASQGYTGLPTDFTVTNQFTVEVRDSFGVGGRFQIQILREFNNPRNQWIRNMDRNNPSTSTWGKGSIAADSSVGALQLKADFAYQADVAAGVDGNTLTASGVYTITGQLLNMPTGSPATGLMTVENRRAGDFITQEYRDLTDPRKRWARVFRANAGTYSPWQPLYAPSAWAGKTLALIGDSFIQDGSVWVAALAARLGCTIIRLGFGGGSMGPRPGSTATVIAINKMSGQSIAAAIGSGDYSQVTQGAADYFTLTGEDKRPQAALLAATNWSTVDGVLFAFGTNDYGVNVPLGVATDTTDTYLGATNKVVNSVLTAYPALRMAFISSTFRSRLNTAGDGKDSDTTANGNGTFMADYVDGLVTVCRLNKVPVLDMMRESGINKYTAGTLLSDGLHPFTTAGNQRMVDKYASFAGRVF